MSVFFELTTFGVVQVVLLTFTEYCFDPLPGMVWHSDVTYVIVLPVLIPFCPLVSTTMHDVSDSVSLLAIVTEC